MSSLDNFFIFANEDKDPKLEKAKAIMQFLELRGKRCGYTPIKRMYETEEEVSSIRAKMPENVDCAIVLGGDGTLIQVAGILSQKNIPLLGVNMGTLGFLAEVEKDHVFDALEKVLKGEYEIEERMMLAGETTVSEIKMKSVHALNDIVISRNGALRIAKFNIFVNKQLLYSVNADGIIISTPTGSTAYNLSAGGPIIAPYAESLIITPICAHSVKIKPVVLSKDDEIRVELSVDTHRQGTTFEVSFDGVNAYPLNNGDFIDIKKSYCSTKIIKLNKASFVEVLSRKMAE